MPKKIFWDIDNGVVLWLEDDEVVFAPINSDNTCDMEEPGAVDWSEAETPDQARAEEARIRAILA